eukprot:30294-Pelagococcus_subviridis.AAC.98
MASTDIFRGISPPFLEVIDLQSLRISRASVPCTAKSAMMTPLLASPHHISNSSRDRPDCNIDGVARTTHGPTSSKPPACERCCTWLNTNGFASSNAAFMSLFKTLMYV